MDIEKENLIKRKNVYLQQPRSYEMSGCKCGNCDTQWSEYQEHLWCEKCQIDFKPEHGGVFDGPIGIGLASLLGVYFHRLNLETNEVEAFISKGYYVKAINFYIDFDFKEKVEVLLTQNDKKLKALLDLNDYSLKFKSGVKAEIGEKNFELIVFTISVNKQFQEWSLKVVLDNEHLNFIDNDNFQSFKKFTFNQKLEYKFPELNKSKITKI